MSANPTTEDQERAEAIVKRFFEPELRAGRFYPRLPVYLIAEALAEERARALRRADPDRESGEEEC